MNAGEKNARIVCRMKSVDVTRVIPSRWAASVAIVDFPSGRAADEQDDRDVELAERMELPQAPHRAAALRLAEHLGGELAEPVEVEAVGAALREIGVGAAREVVRARHGQPGGRERARHEPLRPRAARRPRPAGAGRGSGAPSPDRLRSVPIASARAARALRRGRLPGNGTMSFAASTTRMPRRLASSTTTSTAAAFSSTTKTSAPPRDIVAEARAVGEVAGDGVTSRTVRLREVAARRACAVAAPCRRTRALPGDRLERPRAENGAENGTPGRTWARIASASAACGASGSAIVTSTRSAMRAR